MAAGRFAEIDPWDLERFGKEPASGEKHTMSSCSCSSWGAGDGCRGKAVGAVLGVDVCVR